MTLNDVEAELRNNLQDGQLVLKQGTLQALPLGQLFDQVLATEALVLNDVNLTATTDQVSVSGRATLLGMQDVPVAGLTFEIENDLPVFTLTITPSSTWRLADGFRNVQHTFFDQLELADPSLVISSPAGADGQLQITLATDLPGLGLTGVQITISSETHACALHWESVDSLDIPGVSWFALENVAMDLAMATPGAPVAGEMRALIRLGNTELPVAVPLPAGPDGWQLQLIPSGGIPISQLAAIAGLVGSDAEVTALPEELALLDDFAITNLEVVYSTAINSVSRITLAVESAKEWKIIPEVLTLSRPALFLEVGSPANELQRAFSVQVSGTITLGTASPIPVVIQKDADEADWQLLLGDEPEVSLPSFADLARLIGEGVENFLPQVNFGDVTMSAIEIRFDPANKVMSKIACSLRFDSTWPIIPGQIDLTDVGLQIAITQPENGDRRIAARFQGKVGDIPLAVQKPAGATEWSAAVFFVPLPSLDDLAAMIGVRDLSTRMPSGLENFILSTFEMRFNLEEKVIKLVTFEVTTESLWPLFGEKLKVGDVLIGFDISNPSQEAQRVIDGKVNGTVKLAGVDLPVTAIKTATEVWEITGSRHIDLAEDTPPVQLDQWIQDFVAIFETNLDTPEALKDFVVSHFDVAFTTANDFSFLCQCHSSADGGLAVTIGYNSQQGKFEGSLAMGDLQFDLQLEQGNRLVATYFSTTGQSVNIHNFITNNLPGETAALPGLEALAGLAITLTEAVLVIDGSKFLFAPQMSSQLSTMPFIGRYLDTEPLKLGLRVLAASGDFTVREIQAINALLPESISPFTEGTAISPGASLEPMIDLGFGPITAPVAPESSSGEDPTPDPGDLATPTLGESGVKWIPLQRSLGPLYFSRIGLHFKDQELTFLLDASLVMASLTFSLVGLGIRWQLPDIDPNTLVSGELPPDPGLALANANRPQLLLEGLGLKYQNPPVKIAGLFLRDGEEFAGAATIQTKALTLTALGAYKQGAEGPSMFLFAMLDKELGGPAFFFVTGLAAGFGFNRDLLLPEVTRVADFPLVQAAAAPASFAVSGQGDAASEMIRRLGSHLPMKMGAYWLAAGVRFTSFQLLESTALLFVKFGQELDISLLGISRLILPKPPKKADGSAVVNSPRYVVANLQFLVNIKPSTGLMRAEAQLADGSYVIDPRSRLRGGFAFYLWFAGQHSGDFVLTFGGYHPAFKPPQRYPLVPRLTFDWPYNDQIAISGTAYFALTPSCVMAGGSLNVTYFDGQVRATFTARANFLMNWEPFHYDIDLSLTLSVVAGFTSRTGHPTFSTTISAELEISGPEFYAEGYVEWLTFTVPITIGRKTTAPNKLLTWEQFKTAFLPPPEAQASQPPITQIAITGGLLSETADKTWVVLADEVEFSTSTFIPSTVIQLSAHENENNTASAIAGTGDDGPPPTCGSSSTAAGGENDSRHRWQTFALDPAVTTPELGLRPLGSGPLIAKHRLTICGPGNQVLDLHEDWHLVARRQGVPEAIWGAENDEKEPQPGAKLLANAIVGVDHLRPRLGGLSTGRSDVFALTHFLFDDDEDFQKNLPLQALAVVEPLPADPRGTLALAGADSFATITNTAMAPAEKARRETLIDGMRDAGFAIVTDGSLSRLANPDVVESAFQAPPMLGVLGSSGHRGLEHKKAPPIEQLHPTVNPATLLVDFMGTLYQHERVTATSPDDDDVAPLSFALEPAPMRPVATAGTFIPGTTDRQVFTADSRATAAPQQPLAVGQSLAWQLTHQNGQALQPALAIEGSQGRHLRLATLDKYGRLISDARIEGSETTLHRSLTPAGDTPGPTRSAATVLVTGLAGPEPSSTRTVGWHGESALIRLRPRHFLGDDVLIQTQAARQRRRDQGLGLHAGEAIVNQNLWLQAEDRLTTGWICTYLPAAANIQTLAVILKRSELEAATRPLTNVVVRRQDGSRLQLQPQHLIRESASEYVLLYAWPDGIRIEAGQRQAVTVTTPAGWQLHGVQGMAERAAHVWSRWDTFRLRPAVTRTESIPEQTPMLLGIVPEPAAAG